MRIKSIRSKNELTEVLLDPNSIDGPDPAYWVFSGVASQEKTDENWENMTLISPGVYEKEFTKTYGHYHFSEVLETYKLIHGKGVLLLQKKHFENGTWVPEIVDEVFLIRCENVGDKIVIPSQYGHSWSNIGSEPLITFDDWNIEHTPYDYEAIKKFKGMCYYLTLGDGGVSVEPNPNYKVHPTPKWITPEEASKVLFTG